MFGSVLLTTLPIVIITGLLSYIAYGPQFGQAIPGNVGWLKLPTFDWPTDPSWLYRLNQGLHVGLGLILIPIVLAKLWSVIPRLFTWPPSRSFAQVLERISLLMLVGGILFEIITGVLNIQYDYIFGFSFYTAHYYGAWVFIAGFVIHVVIKFPRMWTGLRSMSMRDVLRTNRTDTTPEPFEPDGLAAENPGPATMSRRGALALVGGGAFFVAVLTAGQTLGGFTRQAALLLPAAEPAATVPTTFRSTGQRGRRGYHPKPHRRAVATHSDRRTHSCRSGPRRPDRHAAAHRATPHRLRGRLVDHGDLDRRAAGRVGAAGGCAQPRVGFRAVGGAPRRIQPRHLAGQSGRAPRFASGASGQRRRPVTGSRISGSNHRSRAARSTQHQVGRLDRFQGPLMRAALDRFRSCTDPIRCTC